MLPCSDIQNIQSLANKPLLFQLPESAGSVFYYNKTLRCTESFAVCRTAVQCSSLKTRRLRRRRVLSCSMLVVVYYQTIALDFISVSLTGIPVLHTVGTRHIAVGIGSINLPLRICIAS